MQEYIPATSLNADKDSVEAKSSRAAVPQVSLDPASIIQQWMSPTKWQIGSNVPMNAAELQKVLNACAIPHEFVSEGQVTSSVKKRDIPEAGYHYSTKEVLWTDNVVQLLDTRVGKEHYLSMGLISSKKFVDTRGKEIIPLRRAIEKLAGRVFKSAFGTDHYTESVIEHEKGWAFQLFPSGNFGTKRKEEVDIYAKVQRNFYIMSRGRFGEAGLSSDKIKHLRENLADTMSQEYQSDRSQRTSSIDIKWINRGKAAVLSTMALLHSWEESGMDVFSQSSGTPQEIPHISSPKRTVTKCAFCQKDVIQKQTIIEEAHHHIMYSYRPYVGRDGEESTHFLVTTKDHLETDFPSDEELIEEHEILVRMHRVMEKQRPGYHAAIIRQQGIKSGQTVFHRHTHFIMYNDTGLPEYYEQLARELSTKPSAPIQQKSPAFVAAYESLSETG
jgi:diadenosine tetraphosphate (Ap4A) HIT family hydrolase